jgi:hypothetical protein
MRPLVVWRAAISRFATDGAVQGERDPGPDADQFVRRTYPQIGQRATLLAGSSSR